MAAGDVSVLWDGKDPWGLVEGRLSDPLTEEAWEPFMEAMAGVVPPPSDDKRQEDQPVNDDLTILRGMDVEPEPPVPPPAQAKAKPTSKEETVQCPKAACLRFGPLSTLTGAMHCPDHGEVANTDHGYCACGTARIEMYAGPCVEGLRVQCPDCQGIDSDLD